MHFARLSWLAALALVAGCGNKDKGSSETDPVTVASPSSTTTAEAAASASAEAEPDKAPALEVAATPATESPWLGKFSAKKLTAEFANPTEAHAACAAEQLELCTEAQYAGACKQDATLAKSALWTVTAVGAEGLVARGGEGKCEERKVAADGARGALCCGRAIAEESANKDQAFLTSTSDKLGQWEAALNKRSTDDLKPLLADSLSFNGETLTNAAFIDLSAKFFKGDESFWQVIDQCKISVEQAAATWTAECKTSKHLDGKLTAVTERLVWGTASGKLQSITEIEVAGKPTNHPAAAGATPGPANLQNVGGRDAQCRRICPGIPVEITHCYCKCMGMCT